MTTTVGLWWGNFFQGGGRELLYIQYFGFGNDIEWKF